MFIFNLLTCKFETSIIIFTWGWSIIRSPLGSVNSLLSSITEFIFSTQSASTSPSKTIQRDSLQFSLLYICAGIFIYYIRESVTNFQRLINFFENFRQQSISLIVCIRVKTAVEFGNWLHFWVQKMKFCLTIKRHLLSAGQCSNDKWFAALNSNGQQRW